jgi:hypothetical protein
MYTFTTIIQKITKTNKEEEIAQLLLASIFNKFRLSLVSKGLHALLSLLAEKQDFGQNAMNLGRRRGREMGIFVSNTKIHVGIRQGYL